jgi:hypothetical protein
LVARGFPDARLEVPYVHDLLVVIHEPVHPHALTLVQLTFDRAVALGGGRRGDLHDEVGGTANPLRNQALRVLPGHEEDVGLHTLLRLGELDTQRRGVDPTVSGFLE